MGGVIHKRWPLPYPPMLRREQMRVRVRRIAYPEESHRDIADHLNWVYSWYNRGCRSKYGVYDLIRRKGMLLV